ncbi:ABC1 kinase family protein [Propionibacteriaceae bacterium G1746]|uniref:ABC1 kinase family protein n=1 Tax=Aestuariimicrobium sp. G57 TaxID=3418485 RepID=UPI003C181CF8
MVEFLSGAGSLLTALLSLAALALQTWLLGAAVRRVLGVRTGMVRTLVVTLIGLLVLQGITTWAGRSEHFIALARDSPGQVAALALVVVLWTFAAAAAALVGLEILVPTGSLPAPQHLFLGWGRRWQQARRNTTIAAIAARHGLSSQLRGFGRGRSNHDETARALRNALNEAGVTFVKLGQMLSTRSDLLPEPYIRELSTLQNRATPIPWSQVATVITESLGRTPDEAFATVEPNQIASASLGQVHRATLHDGTDVVVKVQRPGAAEQVATDLATLQSLAGQLQAATRWAQRMDLVSLVNGFATSLREELNYTVEAANTRAIAAGVANHPRVTVPRIESDLSTDRVLVMQRLDGTPLSQSAELVESIAPETRRAMASDLLGAVLDQVFRTGTFHADLHAGNLMVWPDGRVGLLDFGSVGRLDAASRQQLVQLLLAIDRDDPTAAMDVLMLLLDPPERVDERALRRDLGGLITQVRAGGGSMEVFGSLMGIVVRHGFRIPPMLAAALRALGALEGTLGLLDPRLDLVADAREFGSSMVGDMTPETLKHEVTTRLAQMLPLLERMPRSLARITEDLENGSFQAHVRFISHPDDRRYVTGLVQQVTGAMLAAAAVLGGILLVTTTSGPAFLPGVSLMALFGYLLTFAGFVLALRVVVQMFHRRD